MRKSSKPRGQSDSDFEFGNVLGKCAYDNRFVYIWEEIDDETLLSASSKIQLYLDKDKKKDITFIINSYGGSISAMDAIIEEMNVAKKYVNVNTVVIGTAYSAAATILVSGTKGRRFGRPTATIMFHPTSYGMGHDYAAYQERYSDFMKKQDKLCNNRLLDALGIIDQKARKKFIEEMDKSLWLTAGEAVSRGYIDKIYADVLPPATK